MLNFMFVADSILLGVGLAMDAFSVSVANGLDNPAMSGKVRTKIAGTFAGFQFLMPMIGWMLVHYLLESFAKFQKWIPWIALFLLLYIGGKMIFEALTKKDDDSDIKKDAGNNNELLIQGIATSIDALSVGFTIADYKVGMALFSSLIIGTTTFIICRVGLRIGIKVGKSISQKASILGGCILIFIGLEIFLRGLF